MGPTEFLCRTKVKAAAMIFYLFSCDKANLNGSERRKKQLESGRPLTVARWRGFGGPIGGLGLLAAVCTVLLLAVGHTAHAAEPLGNFSLQITPSPLVATLKPGTTTELELKVHNTGTSTEVLKIEPRSFILSSQTGQVALDDTAPADIASWISFSNPVFTVASGEWFTQKVRISLPKDTGFSYSFALVISRKDNPQPTEGGRLIKGSIADFTLINVDRPGATRKLEVPKFTATHGIYEYLPAKFITQFKNTGNTIVQPYGNIFIGRNSSSSKPISTLPVNETKGYILPGSTRTLTTEWSDGFPVYKTTSGTDGSQSTQLVWNWDQAKLSHFRIGHYTAKLVAVYNDGTRDVPIEQEVSFWIIPWRAILLFLVVVTGLYFLVRWRNKKRTEKAVKKALAAANAASHAAKKEKVES